MDLSANFEELMQRSPISPHDMKNLLREMRRTPSGTVAVSKLLAAKIQSTSEAQAIQAFEFLEAALESETEGSIEFRTEVGRYRFLNEIIRILSPKYLGDKTAIAVKERAIKFLEDAAGSKRKRWFPSEHSKVNSVYQSLVDGGIIQKPIKVTDEETEFQKSIFERGENAVILKRLLQSKDPSDLQAANRLIKNLVDEEARRNERRAELHSLIDRIETSTGLLTEMLSQSKIDKEIVEELVETCRSLRQKLGGVATETNDEVTSLLQASENIENVIALYESKKEFLTSAQSSPQDEECAGAPLVPSVKDNPVVNELSLADQFLMNLGDDKMNGVIQQSHLQQIGACADSDNLLLNLDIDMSPVMPQQKQKSIDADLKPIVTEPFDEISKLSREMMEQGLKGLPNASQSKKTDKTPLSQMKRNSIELQPQQQHQSPSISPDLPLAPTNSSAVDAISLLDLDFLEKSSYSSVQHPASTSTSSNNLNSKIPSDKPNNGVIPSKPQNSSQVEENLLLVLESEKPVESNSHSQNCSNGVTTKNSAHSGNNNTGQKKNPESSQTHSNDDNPGNEISASSKSCKATAINSDFCLNLVRELDLEKIDLLDDLKPLELSLDETCNKDVSLTITFGKYPDFPASVSIAVVTLTNRSKHTGLLNYVFQLLPPKGLQVKLLPPASMELPPWKKTFLPPPILTQVALIASPSSSVIQTQVQPKIRFILSYCVEDETMLHNGDFLVPSRLLQR